MFMIVFLLRMSPPRKREKRDKLPFDQNGVIRFEIDKVSTPLCGNDGIYSPEVEVGGVPWRATTCKSNDGLSVYLNSMVKQGTPWSIDVNAQFVLVNSDSCKNVTFTRIKTFDQSDYYWGGFLLNWEDVIDEEKGFIKDGKITLEIHIMVFNMSGIRIRNNRKPRFDFSTATDNLSDGILLIGDKKVHINKSILALHSPVFNTMFYGKFGDKTKEEMELKEVEHEEFIEMLHVIYPSIKEIRDVSAAYLLKLGDRFQIECLIERVERFLIDSSHMSIAYLLYLSDKYRLYLLQEHCLSKLEKTEDVKAVKRSSFYKDLSQDLIVALFEKLIEVAK